MNSVQLLVANVTSAQFTTAPSSADTAVNDSVAVVVPSVLSKLVTVDTKSG